MAYKNQSLFDSLYKDFHPMVLQMCKGFVKGDEDLAKDLSQDVFINTWNALDKFKGASSHKTWIYRITVNTCLKYIRDKKDKIHVSIEEGNDHLVSESNSNEDAIHRPLYYAIGKLQEVDRLIIMMVLDELEYDEISSIIGISAANLRVKIHRIKKQLKKTIGNG